MELEEDQEPMPPGEELEMVEMDSYLQPPASPNPEDHSVWKGQVMMQDSAKFSVSAFQVSGTSDYLSVELKSSLELVGRIQPSVCLDYINKIGGHNVRSVMHPTDCSV